MGVRWIRKLSALAAATVVGVTGAAVVAQAAPTSLNWGPVSTSSVPPAREFGAMSFDSTRNRTVLWGGGNSAFVNLNDTWEFDGANWVQRTPATSPPALVGSAMAFDSNRNVSVMFGGSGFPGDSAATWEWDGTNWTLRTFATAPPARLWTAMAYDSTRGKIVLFGGDGVGSVDLGDTWEYDGLAWTHMAPANSPSARFGAAMAYDPGLGRIVLFGGRPAGQRAADTWEWDGTNWTQFTPTATPFARFWHTMAFDPQVGHVVVFGGDHIEPFGLGPINDTWEWDGTSWTQDWTNATPSARAGHTMALDANGRVVLFGGSDEGNPGVFPTDTEELGSGIVTPAGSPALTFNPTSLNFGNLDVGVTSGATNINVFNSGTGPLLATISTTGDFAISSTYCPSAPNPFAAGMVCRVFVTFTPTASGDRFGSLVFTGNFAGGSQSLPLHGIGICCDFSISASPINLGIVQGASTTISVNTTLIGAAGTVVLSAQTNDPGITATYNPASITAGGSSTATVSVASTVAPGLYGMNVVGTEGPVFHFVVVHITVFAGGDFSLSANPATINVPQGLSGTSNIGATLVSGAAGPISLSVSSPAPGLSAALNQSVISATTFSVLTVTASAAITPGPYTVTVTGVEGSITHTVSVTVNVTANPSDFSISATPNSINMVQGASATSSITTALVTGGVDTISLSVTAPAGLTATLSATSVATGGGATLTVTASATVTPGGGYTVTITGVGSSSTHSVTVQVGVISANSDFSISANPTTLSLVQGASGTSSIGTTFVTGTPDLIRLSATAPAGVTATLSTTLVNAGGGATLTVAASPTVAPGSYTVTVTGVENGVLGPSTHSVSVTVNVTAAPSDFAISGSPSNVSVVQGKAVTSSITTVFVTGTPDAISLSATSPAGLTATLNPASVNAGGASTLTISADLLATPGTYTVTVTGAEGSATHTTSVTVNVTSAASDFSIAASPNNLTLMQGNSGTSTIITAMVTGTADAVSLSASSSTGGPAASLNPVVVTAGGASTLTVSPDFTTAPGTYVVTVTGTEASGATHSTSVTVTVTAGPRDFSISANPTALSVVQGSSATSSISTGVIGGPGTIVLSSSAPAGGLSATLTPTSISAGGSSTITVSAAYTTAPGTYTVTVTGTEGSNTHSTVIAVTVTLKGIVNGGFETGDFTGWATTGVTAIVGTSHGGAFAAEVGSTSPSTDSTLSQTFTVPAAGGKLTFWYRMSCLDKVKNDWFTATLHDGVTGTTATVQSPICSKTATWTKVTVNVSSFAGHSVTLTLTNHDDGHAGDPTYTLVDDVSLS
jgi:uncharacterized membrane protein